MRIIRSIQELTELSIPSAVAIGNFDGLHKGHITLIKDMVDYANNHTLTPTILTFDPMPEEYFKTNNFFKVMGSEEKIKFFKDLNIKQLIIIPFDKSFSEIDADVFIKNILITKIKSRYIVVGDDFKFGHKRKGDIDLLESYAMKGNFELTKIRLIKSLDKKVSSSNIRQLLIQGKIKEANRILLSPFSISGKVIHGEKKGRELGYPTANIEICNSYPINGIFLTRVYSRTIDGYYGLSSLGNKPTFSGTNNVLETFIFDFESEIYGETMRVLFLEKLRDQIKFKSADELIDQMNKDYNLAIELKRNKYGL